MNINDEKLAAIEAVWEPDVGAMWKLRQGEVDACQIESLVHLLEDIQFADGDLLPRRVVSLVWYLPIFFEWQRQRVAECGGDMKVFQILSSQVVAAVERVLGVP